MIRSCSLAILLMLVACASDTDVSSPPRPEAVRSDVIPASMEFGDWGPATPVTALNSAASDNTPALSSDGLSIYFGSLRTGGLGSFDLWVAHRTGVDAEWGTPENLGAVVNSTAIEVGPYVSEDELFLFFSSSRPSSADEVGSCGSAGLPPCDNDLWVSMRDCNDASCPWGPPVNLGPAVNTALYEGGPTIWRSELYFNRGAAANPVPGAPDPGPPGDIYLSRIKPNKLADGRIDLAIGDPEPVTVLNAAGVEQRPAVRSDGRELLFSSDRGGSPDVWVSTRSGPGHPWRTPVNAGSGINTAASQELHPTLSADGTTVFFTSNRGGNADIYMARRSPLVGSSRLTVR